MPNYRRLFVPGGTYFFTVNLLDRRCALLTENIGALRAAYGYAGRRHPFETVAICILRSIFIASGVCRRKTMIIRFGGG